MKANLLYRIEKEIKNLMVIQDILVDSLIEEFFENYYDNDEDLDDDAITEQILLKYPVLKNHLPKPKKSKSKNSKNI
jgi:hypothetical protein